MKIFFFLLASLLLSFSIDTQAAKTLVYCSEANPDTLNSVQSSTATAMDITELIYDRLATYEPGGTEIIPSLAHKWKVSRDGLTYTFYLRKGVAFQTTKYFKPTRNFNADDVLFTFHRALKKDHPFHKVGGRAYLGFTTRDLDKLIKKVEKIDSHTVAFHLRKRLATFLGQLAHPAVGIIQSKEYADQVSRSGNKENLDLKPVGTGSYLLKKFKRHSLLRFTAHPKHFRGAPPTKNIVFAITPEASVRRQKLLTGECHVAYQPAPSDIVSINKNPKANIVKRPGLNIGYLAFNVEKSPFDNVYFRRAIYHALNRESYIKAIYLENADLAKSLFSPEVFAYKKHLKTTYSYDPEKARKLLKKSGIKEGFEVELWTLPVARIYNPNGKKMGELMMHDLAKVGIKAKLRTFEWGTFLEKGHAGEHQLIQIGWNLSSGDPDDLLYPNLSCAAIENGANWARWCHKRFDQLIRQARTTINEKKRKALYHEAQELFAKEVPWVPIAHGHVYHGVSTRVKNLKLSPNGSMNFAEMSLQ